MRIGKRDVAEQAFRAEMLGKTDEHPVTDACWLEKLDHVEFIAVSTSWRRKLIVLEIELCIKKIVPIWQEIEESFQTWKRALNPLLPRLKIEESRKCVQLFTDRPFGQFNPCMS